MNNVCASYKRCQLLLSTRKEIGREDTIFKHCILQLHQDGDIRWKSVCQMMLRCPELREPIRRFTRKLPIQKLSAKSDESVESETEAEAAYNSFTEFFTEEE